MDIPAYGQQPGMGAAVFTGQTSVVTGRVDLALRGTVIMVSTAVDAGSSPTSVLRAGLVLGKITASGKYKQHDPTATDGSEVAVAVLAEEMSTLDYAGVAADKEAHVFLTGILIASVLPNLSAVSRRQLQATGRYLFNDDPMGAYAAAAGMQQEVAAAGPTQTLTSADVGKLFVTSGACAFTLPAIAAGLGPFEFLNGVDANMSIASAEGDNIITDGDLSADSIAFSTASHKIGGRARFRANAAGTKWLHEILSPPACVVTVAT